MKKKDMKFCCLCGEGPRPEDKLTKEHVPPRQLFPKNLRGGLNLWMAPSHESCNASYKHDEDYLFFASYPIVADANPNFREKYHAEVKRRSTEANDRAIIKRVLNDMKSQTPSGLLLPKARYEFEYHRFERVAIKIGRCLFYRDHKRFMPHQKCVDVRMCFDESEVPEMYRLTWEMSKKNVKDYVPEEGQNIVVVTPNRAGLPTFESDQIFSYRTSCVDNLHMYTLMFWHSFLFCMTFKEDLFKIDSVEMKLPIERI